MLDLCVSLRGASFEPNKEREMSVRIPGRMPLRVTSRSVEERDDFVRVGTLMAAACDQDTENFHKDDEAWMDGSYARRAQMVVNEDEEVEVWM